MDLLEKASLGISGLALDEIADQQQTNVYQQNGYKDRNQYLNSLVDNYGTDAETVFNLAEMLGESEDFDGLVSALEDL